jgi:hypothetical protein
MNTSLPWWLSQWSLPLQPFPNFLVVFSHWTNELHRGLIN